jgi:hypothetical protein
MKPIATNFPQAVHYFEQGVRCVRCLHGEIVQDCDSAEDAYTFFARYDKSLQAFWFIVAACVLAWLVAALTALVL